MEPTQPGGRRLPSAPRERKPVLAVLAALLVVVGALAAGWLVLQAGHKVSAIEITQQVGTGQQILQGDMEEVQVSANSVNYVPWAEASEVTRFFAADGIPPGTLLTPEMVTRQNNLIGSRDVLGLALKDGQMPDNLQVGQNVAIFATGGNNNCPQPVGTTGLQLTGGATVLAISQGAGGQDTDVEVAVSPAAAGVVACDTSNGTSAIAIEPANGAG